MLVVVSKITEWFLVAGTETVSYCHVNVTVCGVFQFAVVKTRVVGDVIVNPVSGAVGVFTDSGILTVSVGSLFSRTVKLLPKFDSSIPVSLAGVSTNPTVSLSLLVIFKAGIVVANAVSVLVIGPKLMVYAWFVSATKSLTPVIVTTCRVFQLAGVKVRVPIDTVPSVVSDRARR